MHIIEQQIFEYMEQVGAGNAELPEDLLEEFAQRCKAALKDRISEIKEREFKLRMSNIGKPLRSLMLDKEYGYAPPTPDFILKMLYGSLYEALTLVLLKASSVNITDQDKPVKLRISNTEIEGTLDVIIDDKVYDIKTASPYSYERKFASYDTLAADDSFGYTGQGFGYAKADNRNFGGWFVINKATGEFKVIEVPASEHDTLMQKSLDEVTKKVKHIEQNLPMPPCTGEVDETYYKKPTGNKVLGSSCRFCPHKFKCHPGVQYKPSVTGKAESPKYVYYTHLKENTDAT
jgi:hypothetical protein